MPAPEARLVAFESVVRVLNGQTLEQAFERDLPSLEPRDRAFARELATGVIRHYFSLSADLGRFVRRPLAEIDTEVLVLLLLGTYQIRHMRVPGFAAVHATVELARSTPGSSAGGLVNAVLRRITESEPPTELDAQATHDHPDWLLTATRAAYPDRWAGLLRTSLGRAPMTVRVNSLRSSRVDYLALLQEAGIAGQPTALAEHGVQFETPVEAAQVPGLADGVCMIQDEGAQLAVAHLQLCAGQRVLDACCAPGNKTSQMPELAGGLRITALDVEPRRVAATRHNLLRMHLSVEVRVADAIETSRWWDGVPFDRILLDVPCSGTGTLRRHPDIKLLRTPEDVQRLVRKQHELLRALWPTLATGGKLVYCTCSLLPQENEQVIEHFLRQHDDALLDAPASEHERNPLLLLPEPDGPDGFFMARLTKIARGS